MDFVNEVKLREVTMRDGFQSLNKFIPTEVKLEILDKIIESGFKEIEVTSFVSSKAIPQLRDSSKLLTLLPKGSNAAVYSALVPNLQGAKMAVAVGVDKLVVVISASDKHNRANLGKSLNESLFGLKDLFEFANKKNVPVIGSIAVAFGCPYEGFIKISKILKLVDMFFSLGASSLILADTIGVATPKTVNTMIDHFKNHFSLDLLTLHFHNNRNMVIENFLSAVERGIKSFDTVLCGIGGCPYVPVFAGNLSTQEVVYRLQNMKINTGIDIEKVISAEKFLEKIIRKSL